MALAPTLASNLFSKFVQATNKEPYLVTFVSLIVFRSFVGAAGRPFAGVALSRQLGRVLDIFNLSRARLERIIIALGVMPYIRRDLVQVARALAQPRSLKKEAKAGAKSSIYALRHRLPDRDSGLFHRRRAGNAWRQPGHCRGRRSGHDVPDWRGDQHRRRHAVPDVAWRTDHRARHRQRRVAHHHGGHSRAAAAQLCPDVHAGPRRVDGRRQILAVRRRAIVIIASSVSWNARSAASSSNIRSARPSAAVCRPTRSICR